MSEWLAFLDNLGALGAAVILGGLVGLERELRGRWAGLRTHMLVCLGAALFVVAMTAVPHFQPSDISRVIQGVVAGIGFLGAGTILKLTEKSEVKGLTTAASVWLAAAVGVTCGLKLYALAVGAVVLTLVVLEGLRHVERVLDKAAGFDRDIADEPRRAQGHAPNKAEKENKL